MRKLFFIAAVAALTSCASGTNNGNATDSTKNKSPEEKNAPVRGLSVTPPVSPVPKQAADSIWNGDYIERYANGIVKKRGYVAGGLASGEWLTFYEDGKPYSKGQYHNGIRVGYGVSWYHNGEMSSEGYYNQGKPVGLWKYWTEEGHVLTEKDYGGEVVK
jgi:hypothetical protein